MAKRSDKQIIEDLSNIECQLSPENLHCDGEISKAQAKKKYNFLQKQRTELVKELGREPTAQELYSF